MQKIKKVSYSEVLDFFKKEHPVDLTSPHFAGNKWGLLHLEWANETAEGEWSLCELDSQDIYEIVCPFHAAEETENTFIETDGMTVAEALDKLKSFEKQYAEQNKVCWEKMKYWHNKDFSPIFLSKKPQKPGAGRRSLVNPTKGNLFHLDGLHRLMRWGLDGRFNEPAYSKGERLTAFIAE